MAVYPRVLYKYGRSFLRQSLDALASLYRSLLIFIYHGIKGEKPRFNGSIAFSYLVQQCAFGARDPGSVGHKQCLNYLLDTLALYVPRVTQQMFTYTDRRNPSCIHHGTNVIASVNPHFKTDRVILCAHWDTRPHADKDPLPSNRTLPVPGANDGASGVAVILEMARSMNQHPPRIGVDLVLFDLEDIGDYNYEDGSEIQNPFCIGSSYFVSHLPIRRPQFGILIDMVGKKDIKIGQEGYSLQYARPIVERVWEAADRVGASAFQKRQAPHVMDDHVPFLKQNIPMINLIDFDYPYWHTRADTPDKCSADSLQQVGDVLVELIYSL